MNVRRRTSELGRWLLAYGRALVLFPLRLQSIEVELMGTKEKFAELLAAINGATDKIADAVGAVKTQVEGLKEQVRQLIADKGMSEAEEEAALAAFDAPLARLGAVESNLRSIGTDEANPVPPLPEPGPAPATEPAAGE